MPTENGRRAGDGRPFRRLKEEMAAGVDERSDEPLGVVEARADHGAAGRAGDDALATTASLKNAKA